MTAVNGMLAGSGAGGRVQQAIALASQRTGVDFTYLLGQAQVESGLNPTVRASGSSATGLYQFIDQSWLGMLDTHGSRYGLGWAANAIQRGRDGRYSVADPQLRAQILELRKHPETASLMAAQFAADNRDYLEQRIGRPVESVDLYMAHFLGPAGAAKFLTSMSRTPNASAAALFPAAAGANRSIFYDRQGNARSLTAIRDLMGDKLGRGARAAGADATALAGAGAGAGSGGADPLSGRTVMPADYLRIAQQQLADATAMLAADDDADPSRTGGGLGSLAGAGAPADPLSGSDWLATQQMLASRAPFRPLAPTAETARLAYLMLATFGR